MKQLTIIIAAAAAFFTASSFTPSIPAPAENEAAKMVFKKDFSNASEVTWKEKSGFYFVNFSNAGDKAQAAYDAEGTLIATSKFIYRPALPAEVTAKLAARFPNALIGSHATELTYGDATSYYVTVATDKQILEVAVSPELSVSIEKRTKLHKN